LRDWNRIIEMETGPDRDEARLERSLTLSRLGEHAQAIAEVQALASREKLPGETLYKLATIYCLCSAAAQQDMKIARSERDKRVEALANRAVELLEQARTLDYFQDAERKEAFKKNKDFAPLQQRDDFRKIIRALELKM